MTKREEEFLRRLRETFRLEAQEHLQAMNHGLLALEQATGSEQAALVESIFREAHSLKGAARAVNITEIEGICQALEDVLAAWRRGKITPTPALFDTLNQTLDAITHQLESDGAVGSAVELSQYALIQKLQQWQNAQPFPPATTETSIPEIPKPSVTPPSAPLYSNGAPPAAVVPPATPEPPVVVSLPVAPPVIEEPPTSPAVATPPVVARPVNGHPVEPPPTAPVPARQVERSPLSETIRIATSKLDTLLLQTEELLAAKLTLAQRATELDEMHAMLVAHGKHWDRTSRQVRQLRFGERRGGQTSENVGELLHQTMSWNRESLRSLENRVTALSQAIEQDRRALDGMVDGLLNDIKKVLMMPFSSLLEMFPKVVRDLARSLGKEVQFNMQGGDIEIDRRILEEIKDPLIHLLRNSLDHGLESPEEREQRGKPRSGTVSIQVLPRDSGQVEIVLADDGGGIDVQKVRDAASRLGHLTPEQNAEMSDEDAMMLIFRSELSTSAIITNVSGRGLGMAIVREKVENMGGQISVRTIAGQGTAFHLLLPLTLATFRGILVEAAGQQFVIPSANVERVVRIASDNVKFVGGRATILLDGQTTALVTLGEVLELATRPTSGQWLSALILGTGHKRIAFQVEAVLDEQEILVKSLGKQLSRVRNIAGATILGSGQVVPILNASDLLLSATRTSGTSVTTADVNEGNVSQTQKSILIAEDSITSRMLLKNILESAGYKVKTTVDGAEAFAAIKSEPFDLLVSDVEMPRLNGFELTASIRADSQVSGIPVVLVTSLASREHKERGMDVGANAYIVKSGFDQGNLLETVRRLIS